MRYLVLSDIHSNLQALEAVLEDATRLRYDRAIVLGDLVGYGGDPSAVIERTMQLSPLSIVRGNHDKVCAGLETAEGFSYVARAAIEWTAAILTRAELDTLAGLPEGPQWVEDWLVICHGAPFDEDYYLIDFDDGRRAMASTPARLCLFGHTHLPAVFQSDGTWNMPIPEPMIKIPVSGRLVVNVGSVGQPRDGDPRAAYGILDTATGSLRLRRVEYDIAGAQTRIREAGLPERLAARLELGQ